LESLPWPCRSRTAEAEAGRFPDLPEDVSAEPRAAREAAESSSPEVERLDPENPGAKNLDQAKLNGSKPG